MVWSGLKAHIKTLLASLRQQKAEPSAPKKQDLELEFLPAYQEVLERPPSRVGRYFALIIMGTCTAILLWSIIGKIDVIASAPGKVIVGHHSKVVQAPEKGEVTAITVSDGQSVKKGDTLIELNPTTTQAEARRLREQVTFSALEVARLSALATDNPRKNFRPPEGLAKHKVAGARDRLLSEYLEQLAKQKTLDAQRRQNLAQQKSMDAVIRETASLLGNVRERYESYEKLADQGNFPRMKLLETQKELIEQQRELAQQKSRLEVLKAEAETLVSEALQRKSEWRRDVLDRLDKERRRLADLRQELIKAREKSRLQTIVAPVDGVVQQLEMHTIGGVVTPGQELMVIVPDSDDLQAEIKVMNKDVGFVRQGQAVEVKIDSFPYTKFGTIPGKVLHVSRDSTEDKKLGLVFPGRVKLSELAMTVDGEDVPITAGMRLTAEIKTGDRRVIEYLLSPLQEYSSEALKER